MATRTDVTKKTPAKKAAAKRTQSPALPVADSHELIRVLGARVNNLKDVSIDDLRGCPRGAPR
jgi:hypothetical protein